MVSDQHGNAGHKHLPGWQSNVFECECHLVTTCYESFSQSQAPGEVPEGLAKFPCDQSVRHRQARTLTTAACPPLL